MNHHYDYLEAGYHIFELHKVVSGKCLCGNPKCTNQYKHPLRNNWQLPLAWSDEQIEVMEKYSGLREAFGVLVENRLVIDIDPRNGGFESYKKLVEDTGIDFKNDAGFVVSTGGGGWHIYYNRDPALALVGKLNEYPGIDFKSSGFVVGAGSLHKSGGQYEVEKGFPDQLTEAPAALLLLLKKPDAYRGQVDGSYREVSDNELIDLLSFVDPDCGYEDWIRIGMAIHETTGGAGLQLWDEWSKNGKKYDGHVDKHWHSFGKTSSAVTLGTIIHHARQGGYVESVTFTPQETTTRATEIDTSGIDLTMPPGLAGELCQWINRNSRYKRENAAAASAICALGNVAGMRVRDTRYGVTTNTMMFCVAGSGTGKDTILDVHPQIMNAVSLGGVVHKNIKSGQEITRALIENQAAVFCIDELGKQLATIANAQKKGGAAYLENIPTTLLDVFTKADKRLTLGFDDKITLKEKLGKQIAQCSKLIDENEDATGAVQRKLEQCERLYKQVDTGLERPFMSVVGFTTPHTFEQAVSYEQVADGFFTRAIITNDANSNPPENTEFKKMELPDAIKTRLIGLAWGGDFDHVDGTRIEFTGTPKTINTPPDCVALLSQMREYFHLWGDHLADTNGLEAITRRAFELVLKISLVLSAGTDERSMEAIKWAFEFVKRDVELKVSMTSASIIQECESKLDGVAAKLLDYLKRNGGKTTAGVFKSKARVSEKDLFQVIDHLMSIGEIVIEKKKGRNGKQSIMIKSCSK